MLLGGERAQDLLTECACSYVLNEIANDLDIDVGLEQRQADLTQRIFDIALGDPPLAFELLEDAFESIAKSVEHKSEPDTAGTGCGAGTSDTRSV